MFICYIKNCCIGTDCSKGVLSLPSTEAECTIETQLLKYMVNDNIWKEAGEKLGNLVNYKVVYT